MAIPLLHQVAVTVMPQGEIDTYIRNARTLISIAGTLISIGTIVDFSRQRAVAFSHPCRLSAEVYNRQIWTVSCKMGGLGSLCRINCTI